MLYRCLLIFLAAAPLFGSAVKPGIEVFLEQELPHFLKGKKIGLLANHVSRNQKGEPTHKLLIEDGKKRGYQLAAIFAPEHGFLGDLRAEEVVKTDFSGPIPIFSLFGETRRATDAMLEGLDVLAVDLQDIGSRSYTYLSSACYFLEAAAKKKLPLIVFDRPNPINGVTVDGPLVEEKSRSFLGYPKVAYCHGMTIGEILSFHKAEEKFDVELFIVPMEGWNRSMEFADTGLAWIPTSPFFPEASTCLLYPTLSFIAELSLTSVGIGYTLPFKVIGAPWIDSEVLSRTLNEKKFPGVRFVPTHFRPFFGKFANKNCGGVLPIVEDPKAYLPIATQYLILGTLKLLYPKEFQEALALKKKEGIAKIAGTEKVLEVLQEPGPVVWKLRALHEKERSQFLEKRLRFLLPQYSN